MRANLKFHSGETIFGKVSSDAEYSDGTTTASFYFSGATAKYNMEFWSDCGDVSFTTGFEFDIEEEAIASFNKFGELL